MSDWEIDGDKFRCWNGDLNYSVEVVKSTYTFSKGDKCDQLWFTLTTHEGKYDHEKVERSFGISGRNLEAFAMFMQETLEENRLRDLVKQYWQSIDWKRKLGELANDIDYEYCMKEIAEELGIPIPAVVDDNAN